MRILIEADSIASERMSGIGHTVVEIISGLNAALAGTNHKLTVVVPYGRKGYARRYGWKNVSIRQLPPGYRYINYALTRTSLPIPIEILFGRGVYIFPNYKNWHVPFSRSITIIHDVAFKLFPETVNPKNLIYLEANFKRWLKRTDGIVSISKQSAAEIKQFFPEIENKITAIHLGVDRSVFFPRKKQDFEKTLSRYGIAKDYFLTVGNIEPRKNVMGLLDAYKIYADTNTSVAQLVIVGGDGWKNEKILEKIKVLQAKGYNIYRPKQYVTDEDLPFLYSGARVLIHVALHEGFGLPPIQAQACGSPVIVSDLAVFHETLAPQTTTYVRADKIKTVVAAMEQAQPVHFRRKSSVKTDLTWDNTVKRLLEFTGIIGQ